MTASSYQAEKRQREALQRRDEMKRRYDEARALPDEELRFMTNYYVDKLKGRAAIASQNRRHMTGSSDETYITLAALMEELLKRGIAK